MEETFSGSDKDYNTLFGSVPQGLSDDKENAQTDRFSTCNPNKLLILGQYFVEVRSKVQCSLIKLFRNSENKFKPRNHFSLVNRYPVFGKYFGNHEMRK
jgi:hypothetical protein